MFSQAMFKNLSAEEESPRAELLKQLYKARRKYGHSTALSAVLNLIIDAAKNNKPFDGNTLRQACIIDALEHNLNLVKKIVNLGATFTREDIEEIFPINNEAGKFLEKNYKPAFRANL